MIIICEGLDLSIIVPMTEWKDFFEDYPWIIQIPNTQENGLTKLSGIECFQIKSFSQERFIVKIGDIDSELVKKIHATIIKTFNPKYKLN
jgi:mRNA interferase MazF